ncbi:membrane protein insertase, YidC/Oxa1 family [Aeromicrobium marinum DSM 15272]|uniref:Membrane protein insertase YidC n=1 Tax=Aeromicrobium marinum DSM 15272 TaxID=585531 RepID=E2S8Q4_9ACTN|nr:membrane protein insertase YidC [Aeromicrobium marinum]EFQ84559.1 membrane protein insertase, YidC/Oxa1 family [Aeromicrobium marinum DSM 15272]
MLDFFGQIGSLIMTPLYYAVSAVLLAWHWVFDNITFLSDGWVWTLSIVGLTVTIRALLIPLFVKQIKSSRNMQLLQPKIKELQKKYGHDRERLTQEQMKLWKETGTNPFASCLPLLAQMPVFFALFRTIDQAAKAPADDLERGVRGLFNVEYVESLQGATIFGARIADTFINTDLTQTRVLTMILVIAMCATQFLTQRQLMAKNMPPDALNGPYAQQQKMLLYILPPVFAIGGIFFPLGVLVYWTTSNLWTMGQQFYVIRRNPAPGTPAFKAKQQRDSAKGRQVADDPAAAVEEAPRPIVRQQPRNQPRSQRKKKPGGPAGSSKEKPK